MTGKVSWSLELPRIPRLEASYVVFHSAASLVLAGPDGRVVLVDPAAGRVMRTLAPPRCVRQ